jgi:hypothetical protein
METALSLWRGPLPCVERPHDHETEERRHWPACAILESARRYFPSRCPGFSGLILVGVFMGVATLAFRDLDIYNAKREEEPVACLHHQHVTS